MSNVTNVIVMASVFDVPTLAPLTKRDPARLWRGQLATITDDDMNLSDDFWVQDGKGPECHVWVGAFNHFHRRAFLDDLAQLAFKEPESLQVLIKAQEDDCFGLWMMAGRNLCEVPLPGWTRHPLQAETLERGQWVRIEIGALLPAVRPPYR
jgi:hypothetical protein